MSTMSPPPPPPPPPKKKKDGDGVVKRFFKDAGARALNITASVGVLILLLLVVILGIFLARVFFTDAGQVILNDLRDEAYARGVITFTITMGTIIIAVALLTSVLLGIGGNAAEERFNRGREVLTVLIGVLGTIVGFYFGTTSTDDTETITIPGPNLAVEESTAVLTTFVFGGAPPYRYRIALEPPAATAIPEAVSSDGLIEVSMDLPATGDPIEYTLTVIDSADRSRVKTGTIDSPGGD